MTFDQIPDGTFLYLDADILTYCYSQQSSASMALLEHCRKERIYGFTAVHTLSEVCHKTMLAEAAKRENLEEINYSYLSKRPSLVRQLTEYSDFIEDLIRNCALTIISATRDDLRESKDIRDNYGLLTNDSLSAHLIIKHGIMSIASNDKHFDLVTDKIVVYRPGDV